MKIDLLQSNNREGSPLLKACEVTTTSENDTSPRMYTVSLKKRNTFN